MTVIDLTHIISADMPVFPGMEQPVFESPLTIEANGFWERRLTLYSHTGTHMDAPAHILPHGPTLDQLPVETFVGPACVVDATGCRGDIPLDVLAAHKDALRAADFLLLRTGWDALWGTPEFFEGFPALSVEAARFVAGCGLKGVGVDAISIDRIESTAFEVHRVFFEAGMVVVENLAGLNRLPATGFTFSCAPLRLDQADGSPVRALALLA